MRGKHLISFFCKYLVLPMSLLHKLPFSSVCIDTVVQKLGSYSCSYVGLFLGPLFRSLGLLVRFLLLRSCAIFSTTALVGFKVRYCSAPTMVFWWDLFFQLEVVFCVSIWTLGFFSSSVTECHWRSNEDCTVDNFQRCCLLHSNYF